MGEETRKMILEHLSEEEEEEGTSRMRKMGFREDQILKRIELIRTGKVRKEK